MESIILFKLWAVIMTALVLISEALDLNKKIKQGSILGILWAFVKGEAIRVKPEMDKLINEKE